jgi:hypothetical protein
MNLGTNYFQHGEIDAGRFLEKKIFVSLSIIIPI